MMVSKNLLFICFVLFQVISCAVFPTINYKKYLRNCNVHLLATMSLLFLNPICALPQDIDDSMIRSMENISRVKYSLKSINNDIEKGSDTKAIIFQVKSLLNNYRLKDSFQTTLALSGSKRDDAKLHAKNAYEDLSSIFEYMTDSIDDVSGNKIPPRELLSFALQAISATSKEIDFFFQDLPHDIVNKVDADISNEFQGYQ